MAKSNNLPAKRYKAGERTETSLRFMWHAGDGGAADGSGGSTVYIDIAKALSQVNRRFYRQGLYYYVASARFSNGSTSYVQLNTIPDTWQTLVAWKRCFLQWMKMNRKANADIGNITPKYHDFKVMMNQGSGTTLDVAYGDITSTSAYTSDEWVTSKFVTEDPHLVDDDTGTGLEHAVTDPDQFTVHMLGPHTGSSGTWTSIGAIRSLNDVWRRDPDAGVPIVDGDMDTDPIANLFDAGDNLDEVRLNMDTDGDEPPYNHDAMTGSASQDETVVKSLMRTGTGAGALAHSTGFCVPFGLLEVNVNDFGTAGDVGLVELTLNLVPGSYHGVHAERVV
jgi:hypothetical protein